MLIKTVSAITGFFFLSFVTLIVWGVIRLGFQSGSEPGEIPPAAILSEQLSDGLIEAQVYILGDLAYRIEIQFLPDPTSTIPPTMPPEVNLSMEAMHMDGYEQQLKPVDNGAWRIQGKAPMAGIWIMSVGYGDEIAEVRFSAN